MFSLVLDLALFSLKSSFKLNFKFNIQKRVTLYLGCGLRNSRIRWQLLLSLQCARRDSNQSILSNVLMTTKKFINNLKIKKLITKLIQINNLIAPKTLHDD